MEDTSPAMSATDPLERLRAEFPTRTLKLLWDGASYHRSLKVRQRAAKLDIELISLPAYSPDFMPVEALWRWLHEDVTYHHCHASAEALIGNVEQFRQRINTNPNEVADRLWVKDHSTQRRKNYESQSRCGLVRDQVE